MTVMALRAANQASTPTAEELPGNMWRPAGCYRAGGRPKMNETCDRCGPGVRAVYRVDRDGELYLCLHCANQLWAALSAQGWNISPIDERELAPQAKGGAGLQVGRPDHRWLRRIA